MANMGFPVKKFVKIPREINHIPVDILFIYLWSMRLKIVESPIQ